MKKPEPFLATAIGSFPHKTADKALDIIFSAIPDAPVWPQLPTNSLFEQMEIQYSEGMPMAVVDEAKGRMHFDTSGDYSEEFALFYETYIGAMDPDTGNGDCSKLAVSKKCSSGIYALEERLKSSGKKPPFVKVQTTGPCSFALATVDEKKRAIYYNEEFRDVIVKALSMKSRWQIQKFAPFCDTVICFIDEPILSAFGSSTYISVKRDDVVSLIREVVDAVHQDKALAGVHCCGNTDWSILIDAGVDIVNFDAFGYGTTIALYPEPVKRFLGRGGILAWGIVPTSAEVQNQTVEILKRHLESLVSNLIDKSGIDRSVVLGQSIITPSCGTGTMAVPDAERVFTLLKDLSLALKGIQ